MTPARAALTVLAVAVCPFATAATVAFVALDHLSARRHDRRVQQLVAEAQSWTTTNEGAVP